MSKISWGKLMQAGMGNLRLTPDQFWALTPAELMLMLGDNGGPDSLSRDSFSDLAARFPDEK